MSEILMCRMCLARDVSLYDIYNKSYHEIYEKLTNLSFHADDGKPTKACYICLSLLKNCYRLKETALKADHILSELLAKKLQVNILQLSPELFIQIDKKSHDMCFSSLTHIDIHPNVNYPVDEMTVLVETDYKYEVCVKAEQILEQDSEGVKDETTPEFDCIHHSTISSSDSEDNLPLKSIVKQKSQEALTVNSKVRKKENKDVIPEECAKEIVLTREQQLEALRERAKSSNYINSPYKCEYCYKGFMSATTYGKHREKHDERAGAHECDVCHMRYVSARQLRSHSLSAHARRYACARCGLRVHTANQAREHLKWHTGFTYECQLCGKKFSKSTSYLTHTRTRHPAPHACPACGLGFVGPRGLLVHRRKAHAAEQDMEATSEPAALRYCRDCDVQFLSVEAWKRHVLTAVAHRPENDDCATCRICNCPVTAGEARLHYKEHSRELRAGAAPAPAGHRPPTAALQCDQCTLTFGNKYKLQSHVKRVHLGLKYNKNVVCEVCGKKCTSNASLRYHQRTHTGERPYPCSACGKRFADSHHLRVHARTHSGERPYACDACDKRFSQKPALNRHLRVHTGAKPYVCTYCTKCFSQTNSLKLHIRSVHLKVPPNSRRNKAHNAVNDNIATVKNE